jgi:hypothetical protein
MPPALNQLVRLLSLIPHIPITHCFLLLLALHIKAEVMRWVYAEGTKKNKSSLADKWRRKPSHGGFLSTFFSTSGAFTPQLVDTPLPAKPVVEKDPLTVTETQVTLLLFSADVKVGLSKKMSTELHRSTKKNPPTDLKFEFIYVSLRTMSLGLQQDLLTDLLNFKTTKEEYDGSIKEDEKHPFATGSVFQGLRADLDGSGSARIFIVRGCSKGGELKLISLRVMLPVKQQG